MTTLLDRFGSGALLSVIAARSSIGPIALTRTPTFRRTSWWLGHVADRPDARCLRRRSSRSSTLNPVMVKPAGILNSAVTFDALAGPSLITSNSMRDCSPGCRVPGDEVQEAHSKVGVCVRRDEVCSSVVGGIRIGSAAVDDGRRQIVRAGGLHRPGQLEARRCRNRPASPASRYLSLRRSCRTGHSYPSRCTPREMPLESAHRSQPPVPS